MSAAKFAITITGNTWDELRASAAVIFGTALSGGALVAMTINQAADDSEEDNAPINANAPLVDTTGLPWDERIHAKSKETNADGKWKRRRKTPDETVAAVEAELRARAVTAQNVAAVVQQPVMQMPDPAQMVAQQSQPVMPPQMTQVYDPAQIAAAAQQQPVQQMQPIMQPQPVQQPVQQFVQPQVQQQPAQLQAIDFDRLMRNIGHGFNNNPATGLPWVDNNVLVRICADVGVNNIGEIATDRNKIDRVHSILVAEGRFPNVG